MRIICKLRLDVSEIYSKSWFRNQSKSMKCPHCSLDHDETLAHFFLICPPFSEQRAKFTANIMPILNNLSPHTPFHLFSDLIHVWNLSTSQSLICLAVAVSTKKLVVFCNLLVSLNLSDLFFLQYSTHHIFCVSPSHVSLPFTIVYLGFCLHLIDFCDIFFNRRFSCESSITSLYLSVFGILFARIWLLIPRPLNFFS